MDDSLISPAEKRGKIKGLVDELPDSELDECLHDLTLTLDYCVMRGKPDHTEHK